MPRNEGEMELVPDPVEIGSFLEPDPSDSDIDLSSSNQRPKRNIRLPARYRDP